MELIVLNCFLDSTGPLLTEMLGFMCPASMKSWSTNSSFHEWESQCTPKTRRHLEKEEKCWDSAHYLFKVWQMYPCDWRHRGKLLSLIYTTWLAGVLEATCWNGCTKYSTQWLGAKSLPALIPWNWGHPILSCHKLLKILQTWGVFFKHILIGIFKINTSYTAKNYR